MKQTTTETRARFADHGQKEFLEDVCRTLNCDNLKDLLEYNLGISYSALKRYKREELLLPYSLVVKLCELSGNNIEELLIKERLSPNWGQVKGGKRGIQTTLRKYKELLPIWRAKNKDHLRTMNLKQITTPNLNEELAEFIGICLGDGTITNYFVRVSGDSRYDGEYFCYIARLMRNLFGIGSSTFKDKRRNILYLQLSSRLACRYLTRNLKLPLGDKFRKRSGSPLK